MADPFLPDPYVEVAFGFGPYDTPASGDWIDITDYVDEVHTSRGRTNELDTFPAGQMKLRLDNRDRRFDPLNTAGPYFGDLTTGTQVRLRADIATVKYDIWYGFVDGWPTSYADGGWAVEMDISCHDIFQIFSERSAPDVLVEDIEAMVGGLPLPAGIIRRWYRFDQVRGGEQVISDSYGTGQSDLLVYGKWDTQERVAKASVNGAIGLGEHTAPDDTWNKFKGASNVMGPFDNAPWKNAHWAIAMTVRVTEPGEMGGYDCALVTLVNHLPYEEAGFTSSMTLALHQGGQHHPDAAVCPGCIYTDTETAGTSLFFSTGPGSTTNAVSGGSPYAAGTFNPFDGEAHSLVLWRANTTLQLWADGVLVGSYFAGGAVGLPTWDPGAELRVYWPFQGLSVSVGRRFPGVILQEMIFFDVVNPSTFNPVDVHDVLMVGMAETVPSGDAAAHLMNRIGWNPLKQIIDACEVQVVAPANPYGQTVMQLLQNYADCEDGRLFVDRTGKVAFHAAGRFQTAATETTVQYTFDDTAASSVSIDGELRVTIDDEFVYEAAEVSRDQGATRHASTTATPKRTYGLSGLRLLNDHQAQARAERIVFKYGTPKIRTESYDVWPEADPTDWVALLGLDIGHRVRLIVTPRNVGSQIDIQQHLELIEHHITPTDWVMTLNGSPVDDTVYLTWGGTAPQGWGNGAWR